MKKDILSIFIARSLRVIRKLFTTKNIITINELCAAHEIGHYIVADYYGLKTLEIDIKNPDRSECRIDYGTFSGIVRKIGNKVSLSSEDTKEEQNRKFVVHYVAILLAGDICEHLYSNNFNCDSMEIYDKSSDSERIDFILQGIRQEDQIVRFVLETKNILMVYHDKIPKFVQRLIRVGHLKECQIPAFLAVFINYYLVHCPPPFIFIFLHLFLYFSKIADKIPCGSSSSEKWRFTCGSTFLDLLTSTENDLLSLFIGGQQYNVDASSFGEYLSSGPGPY